jgi:hypothetical protein
MNRAIELHDTSVVGIVTIGAQVVLFLRAYVHQTDGVPGVDAGTGWIQAAVLRIGEASFGEGSDMPELPAPIQEGELLVGEETRLRLLPLPFQCDETVTLRLQLDAPATVTIQGRGAEVVAVGEPVYIEDVP